MCLICLSVLLAGLNGSVPSENEDVPQPSLKKIFGSKEWLRQLQRSYLRTFLFGNTQEFYFYFFLMLKQHQLCLINVPVQPKVLLSLAAHKTRKVKAYQFLQTTADKKKIWLSLQPETFNIPRNSFTAGSTGGRFWHESRVSQIHNFVTIDRYIYHSATAPQFNIELKHIWSLT